MAVQRLPHQNMAVHLQPLPAFLGVEVPFRLDQGKLSTDDFQVCGESPTGTRNQFPGLDQNLSPFLHGREDLE